MYENVSMIYLLTVFFARHIQYYNIVLKKKH